MALLRRLTARVEAVAKLLDVVSYRSVLARGFALVSVDGEPVRIEASGLEARVLQHEIDHLNGTLYVDRMEPRSLCTLDNYSKHWRDLPINEVRMQLGRL